MSLEENHLAQAVALADEKSWFLFIAKTPLPEDAPIGSDALESSESFEGWYLEARKDTIKKDDLHTFRKLSATDTMFYYGVFARDIPIKKVVDLSVNGKKRSSTERWILAPEDRVFVDEAYQEYLEAENADKDAEKLEKLAAAREARKKRREEAKKMREEAEAKANRTQEEEEEDRTMMMLLLEDDSAPEVKKEVKTEEEEKENTTATTNVSIKEENNPQQQAPPSPDSVPFAVRFPQQQQAPPPPPAPLQQQSQQQVHPTNHRIHFLSQLPINSPSKGITIERYVPMAGGESKCIVFRPSRRGVYLKATITDAVCNQFTISYNGSLGPKGNKFVGYIMSDKNVGGGFYNWLRSTFPDLQCVDGGQQLVRGTNVNTILPPQNAATAVAAPYVRPQQQRPQQQYYQARNTNVYNNLYSHHVARRRERDALERIVFEAAIGGAMLAYYHE